MQFSLASGPTYLSLVLQCGKCCRPVPTELTILVLIVWFDFLRHIKASKVYQANHKSCEHAHIAMQMQR